MSKLESLNEKKFLFLSEEEKFELIKELRFRRRIERKEKTLQKKPLKDNSEKIISKMSPKQIAEFMKILKESEK